MIKYDDRKVKRCSTSLPGGNQVDGLPPVPSDYCGPCDALGLSVYARGWPQFWSTGRMLEAKKMVKF